MQFAPVLHAEWLKIRTLRSLPGALVALFVTTTVFSALAGTSSTSEPEFDPLFTTQVGVFLGQIAAISFGAMAVSAEFRNGALRLSLAAVPQRGHWFAAKMTAIALPALAVGLLTALASSSRRGRRWARRRTGSPRASRRARSWAAASTSC